MGFKKGVLASGFLLISMLLGGMSSASECFLQKPKHFSINNQESDQEIPLQEQKVPLIKQNSLNVAPLPFVPICHSPLIGVVQPFQPIYTKSLSQPAPQKREQKSQSVIDISAISQYFELPFGQLLEKAYGEEQACEFLCGLIEQDLIPRSCLKKIDKEKLIHLDDKTDFSSLSSSKLHTILALGYDEIYELRLVNYLFKNEKKDVAYTHLLGLAVLLGKGIKKNKEGSIRFFQRAADQGYSLAQGQLSSMYMGGTEIEKDFDKAFHYAQKAAEQGDVRGYHNLGFLYDKGQGVGRDYHKSIFYYQRAAAQRNIYSYSCLGYMYCYGHGVEKDFEKAFEYYKKAADGGCEVAYYNLGRLYQKGDGVDRDLEKAVYYYELAADEEEVNACYALGKLHMNGWGVPKDQKKGVDYYLKAADLGHGDAQYEMSDRYKEGRGVKKDMHKAFHYYELLYNQGRGYHSDLEKLCRENKEIILPAAQKGSAFALNRLNGYEQLKVRYHKAKEGNEEEKSYLMKRLGYSYIRGTYPSQDQIDKSKGALDVYMLEIDRFVKSFMGIATGIKQITHTLNKSEPVWDTDHHHVKPVSDISQMGYKCILSYALFNNAAAEILKHFEVAYLNDAKKLLLEPGFYVTCLDIPCDEYYFYGFKDYTVSKGFWDKTVFLSLSTEEPYSLEKKNRVVRSDRSFLYFEDFFEGIHSLIKSVKSYGKSLKESGYSDGLVLEFVKELGIFLSEGERIRDSFNEVLLKGEDYLNHMFLESIGFYEWRKKEDRRRSESTQGGVL